jgi:hypothetical protein
MVENSIVSHILGYRRSHDEEYEVRGTRQIITLTFAMERISLDIRIIVVIIKYTIA